MLFTPRSNSPRPRPSKQFIDFGSGKPLLFLGCLTSEGNFLLTMLNVQFFKKAQYASLSIINEFDPYKCLIRNCTPFYASDPNMSSNRLGRFWKA